MNNKIKIGVLLLVFLLGLLIVVGFFVVSKNKPSQKTNNTSSITGNKFEDVKADLDGDGSQETLRLATDDKGPYLVVLDAGGKEIGPHSLPLPTRPFSNSGKAIVSDSETKQQFVSFDFVVGPHSSNTMFFGLQQYTNAISLVCHEEEKTDPESCFFWSGEIGGLVAKDLDNDGALEIVETVDEYPKDGSITADIEKIINEQFKDLGQDAVNGMIRIAKREQGGRGNKAIWGVYRFNGNFFEEQTGVNYDKYYTLVSKYLKTTYPTYPTTMKKNAMSKDSVDYNLFMRQFWTNR
ncbi:MAG: hypothetical protein Q7K55_05435 [Candidatus Levybacteria bacterium]|nr:hypothetical protein [Candidatus Levybacteria bacterium]